MARRTLHTKMSTISVVTCLLREPIENNRDAGDLRRHLAHYGVTVMPCA